MSKRNSKIYTMKFIYRLTMTRSKRMIITQYGQTFWDKFKKLSEYVFNEVLAKTPDIGNSLFSFNYSYAPSYVAWYKAMSLCGLDAVKSDKLLWKMNEKMLLTVPKPFLHMAGKTYLNSFRKNALLHIQRQNRNELHPYDWEIAFRDIDKNNFEIDITRCGFITYAKEFGAQGMLPGICNVDYMISHYMGNGFVRTKTLGYGDDCCNCHYALTGVCSIVPEAGLK